jgi:CheY-like chemotaxis protein
MEEICAMRILIVDTDVIVLERLELFLNTISHNSVKTACSARDALTIIAQASMPFDCILLDMDMPQMNGIEILSEIRRLNAYALVPVIMLTATGAPDQITKVIAGGACDYIVKPLEMIEVQARIETAALRDAERKRLTSCPEDRLRRLEFPAQLGGGAQERNALFAAQGRGGVKGDALITITEQPRACIGVLTLLIDNFDDLSRHLYAQQMAHEFANVQGIVSYQGEGVFMALSFAFDALGQAPLEAAAFRAATATDAQILQGSGHSTRLLVGRVLSRDLPKNVEPAYMLKVARDHLLTQDQMRLE